MHAGVASSAASEVLIDKLISEVHPMLMEWEEIGCSYKTTTGMKVVLQVRLGLTGNPAAGAAG